ASIHDLTRLCVDPVHLEHSLCHIQSICRSIHFGPSLPQVVCRNSTLAHRCRSVLEGPLLYCLALHPRREGGVHAISVELGRWVFSDAVVSAHAIADSCALRVH